MRILTGIQPSGKLHWGNYFGAMKIAGKKWNSADTYYTIRDKVIPGNAIDDAHIEKGMSVWMKK